MELPDDLVTIVNDFSRPVTRPDWRNLHRMSEYYFHTSIASTYNNFDIPVIERFVDSYDHNTCRYWFHHLWNVKPYLCLAFHA